MGSPPLMPSYCCPELPLRVHEVGVSGCFHGRYGIIEELVSHTQTLTKKGGSGTLPISKMCFQHSPQLWP